MKLWLPDEAHRAHLPPLPAAVEVGVLPLEGPFPIDIHDVEFLVPPFGPKARLVDALERMTTLRVVQSLGASVDWILPLLPAGITLCDASGVHDAPVAEWVLGAILAMEKRLPELRDLQNEQCWQPGTVEDIEGKVVLILGHGSIGRAVERRLLPFGVDVVRVARRRRAGVHATEELPALLPTADVVVVLLPHTAQTEGLVDTAFFGQMKQGALLVNAGRGKVVDSAALERALRRRRIRAALDVTDPEPLPHGHPLWTAPGVLITPHVAGSTPNFPLRAYRFVGEQVRRYLDGEPLVNVVTKGY